MFAGVVITGLVGAAGVSAAAGIPTGSLPGVALGSGALLLAERTLALFAIWMLVAVVVIRAFKNQIPVEISGRGVRYAEADDVRTKAVLTEEALHDVDVEMRWLREAVVELRNAASDNLRKENQGGW